MMIGVAYGGYSSLFTPAMKKVTDSRTAWDAAKKAANDAEGGYQASLDDQPKYAKQIIEGYYQFHYIQDTMPEIYNLKEVYANKESKTKDEDAMREYYHLMATGEYITKLEKWAKTFHLPKSPEFDFRKDLKDKKLPLGADVMSALPDKKLVEVAFPDMHFEAKGYNELLQQIAMSTGYGFFPLIIDSKDGSYTIEMTTEKNWANKDPRKNWQHNPNKPLLKTNDFTAKAYFFTKGWDPVGVKDAAALIDKAKGVIANPPTAKKGRSGFTDTCPPVLWIFPMQAAGVTP